MKKKIAYSEATIAEVINHVLRDAGDINVIIGPMGRNALTSNRSYFIVATCDQRQQFRCDQVLANAEDRTRFVAHLARHTPRVIHDLDDELEIALLCEALWPGPQIAQLRKAVEAEARQRLE